MKFIKMFGLAALAAVAAMAFVGASSASATTTVLCEVNQLVCPENKQVEHRLIIGLSEHALLLTDLADVLCTHSEIVGEVLLLDNPLVGHLEELIFSNCTESIFGTSCAVSTVSLGLLNLLKTGPNSGIISAENNAALVNCSSLGLHCVYGNPETELEVEGSNGSTLAEITADNETLPEKEGGLFCPDESRWDATYTVSAPADGGSPAVDLLYIAE